MTARKISFSFVQFFLIALIAVAICLVTSTPASAIATIFDEDFEGYTSFPVNEGTGIDVNPGVPLISEGANEVWYGGRFESPDNGSIEQDVAVMKIFGEKVGRAEDDAGLIFKISTENLMSVELSYDWRTFKITSGDLLRVGYYAGNITGLNNPGDTKDFTTNAPNWNAWTEIFVGNGSSTWHTETYSSLPLGQAAVYVAFWMDDGEGDYIKIDNILVTGLEQVPEPTTFVLAGMGACALGLVTIRRRRARKVSQSTAALRADRSADVRANRA